MRVNAQRSQGSGSLGRRARRLRDVDRGQQGRLRLQATGRSASSSEIHISRFDGGKVVEHWSVTDQLGMLQQLGLTFV
jgi:predicted ester cyclase